MLSILASAAFGFFKGYSVGPMDPRGRPSGFQRHFAGPITEELFYQGALGALHVPGPVVAAKFAYDHIAGEKQKGHRAVLRFADVLAGGLLYQKAYEQYGMLGAIASHVAHNVAVSMGRNVKGKRR